MARGIEKLHPTVQNLANRLVEECNKQGLAIKIGDTLRTKSEQDSLYAQGRTKPGNKVTNAKYPQSNHCWGIAFDFFRNDGRGAFDDNDGFFTKVGQVGKSIGLFWGGDFKSFKDKPHFEYTGFGLWSALKNKYGTLERFMQSWGSSSPQAPSTPQSNLLKNGSRGQAVTDLQNKLNGLGYSCGNVDGIYGTKTTEAVKAFQKDKGLSVDGIVGDNTRNALNNAQSAPSPKPTGGKDIIKEYQRELNEQFKSGLVVDGIWGAKTEGASPNVKKGAKGNLTRIIQRLVGATVDGDFGRITENKVMAFQKAKGLSIDGIVGKKTWKALLN